MENKLPATGGIVQRLAAEFSLGIRIDREEAAQEAAGPIGALRVVLEKRRSDAGEDRHSRIADHLRRGRRRIARLFH